MRHTIYLLIILLFSFFSKSVAQNDEFSTTENPSVGVVAGYSGFKKQTLEIGIGYQPWQVQGNFVSYPFAGFLALYEYDIDQNFYGTSLNAWYLAGFFSCGLSLNRYSDFKYETYGIKPMIGMSCLRIGVMYGYNFFSDKNKITDLPHHSITIKYYLPLWKKKEKKEI